jgi:beta-galactosidase
MKTSMNFAWSFVEGYQESYLKAFPKDAVQVDLPHAAKILPLHYFDEKAYQGLFTYEKIFDLPEPKKPVHILTFDGAMLQFDAYLNGEKLGHFISGYFPVSIDISATAKAKKNRLVVVLDAKEDPSIPPFGKAVDYLTFAGLYREVHIDSHEESYLSDLFIHADVDGKLTIAPTIAGLESKLQPHYALYEGEHLILEFDEASVSIPHPHLWSIKDPFRYKLVTSLGGEEREDYFGIREAVFDEGGFFLNGDYTKLIGLNRHQNYPYVGPAMPEAGQRDDARILKEQLGCTIVRTSHYADDESFLDECDQIGLLVIDEVPGWQYIGKDKYWRANFLDFTKRLILKERNHPCLIGYGLRIDESPDDHELYSAAETMAHTLDPYRQTLGVRNFKGSECLEDIYAYNDFSCSGLDHGLDDPHSWKAGKDKAMLVSEFNGHMFPTKSFDSVDRRIEHALRHARVLDDAYSYSYLAGAIGWCAFDYNTHQDFGSGDHICYHGVSDIFRNPKYAAALYASQSQQGVFEVAGTLAVGDSDECLMHPLYVFSDCDYVTFSRNGHLIGKFYPDKKDFPHLPHAPILIDDFIGDTFNEPRFKAADAPKIKAALNYAAQHGFSRLPFALKFFMGRCLLKYHLSFDDLTQIYSKYISNWGEKAAVWEVQGYQGETMVALKKIGPSTEFHYQAIPSKTALTNTGVYDVARIAIKKLDQFGTPMAYASDALSFSVSGPIAILGPSLASLEGGDYAIYLRSLPTDKPTEATLTITGESGSVTLRFSIA